MKEQKTPDTQRIQQFFDAVAKLTPEERSGLRLSAHKLLHGTGYESPDDLLHEAIHSVATNSRAWRPSVDMAVFLYQSMRSIASIPRRDPGDGKRRQEISYEDWSFEDQEPSLGIWNRPPEELLMLRQQTAEALRLRDLALERLAGDSDARAILEAKSEDASGAEIRAELGLPERQFKAAEERARYALRQVRRANKP